MQKILRRTALAKAQAKRKAKILADHEFNIERKEARELKLGANRERARAIKEERQRRRDDWELGPLSPWRNNFNSLADSNSFGTWSMKQVQLPKTPERDRMRDWMIREGDRVVVVEGHESIKGRVGKVKNIDREQETLIVEGISRAVLAMSQDLQSDNDVEVTEIPIQYRSVRLVYPLPDPSTGVPRDVVINNLTARRRRFDIYENKEVFERWLEPQHVRIPWPEKTEPRYIDEDVDTLRIDSEQQSFLPTLLRPPMPMSVIDELRNKYSKYRDRHDDDFVAKKMAEDEVAAIGKQRRDAVVPRGTRNIARQRASLKPRRGQPLLSNELAAQIGEHIAASRIPPTGGEYSTQVP